jgi:hypothetical protein
MVDMKHPVSLLAFGVACVSACGDPTVREECEDICGRLTDCGVEVDCDGWVDGCVDLSAVSTRCDTGRELTWQCMENVSGECKEDACGQVELGWFECTNSIP